jgi:uncharacterized membrane protein YhaH (DUF805 family)
MALTNLREILGFFLAHCFRIAFFLLLGYTGALAPLYTWAHRIGGQGLSVAIGWTLALIVALVMLPLFLTARGLVGGTPAMISGAGGGRAITTTVGEIGAYLLAQIIGIVTFTALNTLILAPFIYTPLFRSGHAVFSPVIAQAIGLVVAAIVFVVFVALRGSRFGYAIASGFLKYVDFRGRASRPEYWYWVLFAVIVAWPLALVEVLTYQIPALTLLFNLATLLPSLAVAVRRLHDTNRSGWFLLVALIPFVGSIILIVFMCLRGTPEANRFGAATV